MIKKIQSLQHPLVKHLIKLRQNSDYRIDHKSVVIEGTKMVKEVGQKHRFKGVMVTDETLIPKGIKSDEILLVTEAIMEKVSGLKTPEGILGEIEMPKSASLKGLKKVIALDGVNDPGNLGTLLRTALALGWEGAFILNESCDPFNEKALRAARGATFHLPIAMGKWDDLKKLASENHLQPFVADIEGENCQKLKAPESLLLVLGNEALGTSEAAARFCKKVAIPMAGKMESLNVAIAGAILMFAWMGK
jgi:TrmH family RNA methyltransferase